MTELPAGWTDATLGEVGEYLNGRGFKKSEWREAGRPIIRIQNLTGSRQQFNYFDGMAEERYTARPGDVLVSRAATLGVFVWQGPEAVVNQHIFKVRSYIDHDFHRYLILSVLGDLRRQTHGSGMVHITKGRFEQTPVAIPPLAEQKRIVSAIEEQFSRIDAGVAALERARRNLQRMVRALLANAASGRLTAGWRREADTPLDAQAQFSAVQAERREHKPSRGRGREPTAPTPELLGALPPGWTCASVDQLCSVVTDGEHLTPPRTESGVMLLSARNVQDGALSFETLDYVSEATYKRLKARIEITAGDVLLSCSGSVGRAAVVPSNLRFALVRSVAVLRPLRDMGPFLALMLRSPQLQQQINARKTETAQANIFQGQIKV